MSGAIFILAVNLTVTGLLAAAFLKIANYDRRRAAPRWFALAYLLGALYYLAEGAIPLIENARPLVVLAFTIFLAATTAFNVGVARKYKVVPPWRVMTAVFAISVVAVWFAQDLPRQSFLRILAYQAPFVFMQAIAVGIVLSAPRRNPVDRWLVVLLGCSAAQFLSKPFAALMLGGWGAAPQDYIGTTYALFSQALGAVFAVAVALMMLVILVRDTLLELAARSETDTLSGLLNRRGFEAHAQEALVDADRRGLPLALVIADLDAFKAINDTYGHAAGDNVIAAFSRFLKSAASDHHVVGRIGGEEFAVVLPGTNLVAARLFAEGARNAFGTTKIDGIPKERRVSASFGVAERIAGESVSALMKRADAALYEAKGSGRDAVRIALAAAGGHGVTTPRRTLQSQ